MLANHITQSIKECVTYETANYHGRTTFLERRYPFRHDFDDGDGAEDADKGPEDGDDGADLTRFLLAVAEEVGDGVWNVFPWRRRDIAVE